MLHTQLLSQNCVVFFIISYFFVPERTKKIPRFFFFFKTLKMFIMMIFEDHFQIPWRINPDFATSKFLPITKRFKNYPKRYC